ncbi:MAG TPA: hypothetical protein PLO13_06990 [Anaerolineaceae bacterium]|nr:hypothetical protein [Anaerolineaceae bacterium]
MDDNRGDVELGDVRLTAEAPVEKQEKTGRIWLILITVLLAGLLILNLLEFFAQKSQQELAAQRAETYSERVSEALSTYLDTQIKLDSLLDDYNEAVYEDEDVTNINQQQLRSTEFNFIVLSYIARQNQEIILLLSSLP